MLELIGGKPRNVKAIHIVDKIYQEEYWIETQGLWLSEEGRILIKRSQLKSLNEYAGTLLHECAHALSGEKDVSRDFERKLTDMIGNLAARIISD